MSELKQRIPDDGNDLDDVLVGGDHLPDMRLVEPEEERPIGHWGRMRGAYLMENMPVTYSDLLLSGKLPSYLADIDEQARERLGRIITQMKAAEGVTEDLKRRDQMAWVGAMNSIRNRAEEIILSEIIYQ